MAYEVSIVFEANADKIKLIRVHSKSWYPLCLSTKSWMRTADEEVKPHRF